MINYNFWIMDALTSALIFLSAVIGERKHRKSKEEALKTLADEYYVSKEEKINNEREYKNEIRMTIGHYALLNLLYFTLMACVVTALRYYPTYIIYIQHIAVVMFIMIAFDDWLKPTLAYPLGILLSVTWFISGQTAYRWIMNNIIIVIFTLMIGDIQFKNFAMLQIFMWSAFVYDVCVLAQGSFSPSFFSVTIEQCDTLMCHLFQLHDKWQLPSVFTVKFGDASQVFLGTGDILLGALVVNFSKSFFKSIKYVIAVVLSFSFAIGLLSQIDAIPFPALASIVPVCTTAIILCALISGKTKQLFSFNSGESTGSSAFVGLMIA